MKAWEKEMLYPSGLVPQPFIEHAEKCPSKQSKQRKDCKCSYAKRIQKANDAIIMRFMNGPEWRDSEVEYTETHIIIRHPSGACASLLKQAASRYRSGKS